MDELRVTAAYFIKESNMTKASKLQLMNFLENEATDAQVMALLLDGKVQQLDEQAEEIVYDRFDAALLDEGFGSFLKQVSTNRKAILAAKKSGETAAKSKGLSKKAVKTHASASAQRKWHSQLVPGDKEGQRAAARIGSKLTRKLPFGKSPAAKRAAAAMRG